MGFPINYTLVLPFPLSTSQAHDTKYGFGDVVTFSISNPKNHTRYMLSLHYLCVSRAVGRRRSWRCWINVHFNIFNHYAYILCFFQYFQKGEIYSWFHYIYECDNLLSEMDGSMGLEVRLLRGSCPLNRINPAKAFRLTPRTHVHMDWGQYII